MSDSPATTQVLNLDFILQVIRKYSLYIVGVTGLACILAIVLTMPFIYPPEFKSSAIIYPTNSERFDVANVFAEEPDVYAFGTGKELEKLENIANSEAVKMHVIETLNLWEAYGVDPNHDESPKYYVLRTYDGMVKTTRVEGHGLEIEAHDVDPERAATIVNLIMDRVNELSRGMMVRNKNTILELLKDGAQRSESHMAMLADSLTKLRQTYKVLRTEEQTDRMIEAIMQAEAKGSDAELQRLVDSSSGNPINLETFIEGLDKVLNLENLLEEMNTGLGNTREKIGYLESMDEVPYQAVMFTDRAHASDKKARPVRWLILLATGIIALVVSVFGAVLIDRLTDQ
ncbi:MAG: hypothetical protein AAF804_15260 [Bacteroidota bacterium]